MFSPENIFNLIVLSRYDMHHDALQITRKEVARFAIMRQHLSGRPAHSPDDSTRILNVFTDINYLQLDPTSTVDRSQFLALWSRIGNFDRRSLLDLIYRERRLVESYAYAASICLVEDLPLLRMKMLDLKLQYMKKHPEIRTLFMEMKDQIKSKGPTLSSQLSELETKSWLSGWGHERQVNLLLDRMHRSGELVICDRTKANQKLWDIPDRFFDGLRVPDPPDIADAEKLVFMKSLHSLGIASIEQVSRHYVPLRIRDASSTAHELQEHDMIVPVEVTDLEKSRKKKWYISTEDVSILDRLDRVWKPRAVLLSPFDNLIIDRMRTQEIFGFDSRLEMYVPKSRRRYGFFTMPFLKGDRIIGRIDPRFDRTARVLTINAIHDERKYLSGPGAKKSMSDAISSLGDFLKASDIRLPPSF